MFSTTTSPAAAYRRTGVQTDLEAASPHRIIAMLLERFLAETAMAAEHIQRGDVQRKGEALSRALAITGALQASLNAEAGGEIAANLGNLYDYVDRLLLGASVESNPAPLFEAIDLIREIYSAWTEIAP